MPLQVLNDDDVLHLSPAIAVDAMRDALVSAFEGRLLAPPRVRLGLDELAYVFTGGGFPGGSTGFRAYRVGQPPGEQLVAVWDRYGRLQGIVVGDELGARRTGALGAVAADVLALAGAGSVGVIGSGTQAWNQLWALRAVRAVRSVRVYSRNPGRRMAFADAVARQLDLEASAVASASAAISGADLVIIATTSEVPVINAADVAAGAHVVTGGPKAVGAHEIPIELVEAAAIVTCDSLSQAVSDTRPFFTKRQLVDLGAVVTGATSGRRAASDITLHCSVGLAGTEVSLAGRLFAARLET